MTLSNSNMRSRSLITPRLVLRTYMTVPTVYEVERIVI